MSLILPAHCLQNCQALKKGQENRGVTQIADFLAPDLVLSETQEDLCDEKLNSGLHNKVL